MSETLSKYQYLQTKTPLLPGERPPRKVSMALTSSLRDSSFSTLSVSDTSCAASSSTAAASPPPRLCAVLYLYRFSDRLRVSFPRKVHRLPGLCGGMEFHALMYVSLTHSSASSALPSMFCAIEVQ